jgi:hypothetical protein
MAHKEAEALYIEGKTQAHEQGIVGVLTPEQIDACYRYTPSVPVLQ